MLSLLQIGLPGLPELLLIALILAIFVGLGVLVYRDAKSRGSERALLWGFAVPVLAVFGGIPGLLVVVGYYVLRD